MRDSFAAGTEPFHSSRHLMHTVFKEHSLSLSVFSAWFHLFDSVWLEGAPELESLAHLLRCHRREYGTALDRGKRCTGSGHSIHVAKALA